MTPGTEEAVDDHGRYASTAVIAIGNERGWCTNRVYQTALERAESIDTVLPLHQAKLLATAQETVFAGSM